MIDFRQFKKSALSQLKGRWQTPVLMTVLVSAIFSSLGFAFSKAEPMLARHSGGQFVADVLLCAVSGTITAASAYFYLKMSRTAEQMSFDDFLVGLGDYFLSGILGFLWFMLWTTLWMMLFVIPGIIKAVSYSMMFYVIVENPGIGVAKAMNISKHLTLGHKSELFVMYMSFLGWFVLSCLTFGIGFFWLNPYMSLSYANAYTALKMEAIQRGILKPSDFSE